MTILQKAQELKKGCGKDLDVFHGLADEKIYWKCGERVTNRESWYCPSCKFQAQILLFAVKDELEFLRIRTCIDAFKISGYSLERSSRVRELILAQKILEVVGE